MRLLDKTKQLWNTEKGNAKRNFLKLILAAPFWILLAAVILLSFGIGRAVFLIGSRPDYQVARLWQGKSETGYRHMCVYARGVRAEGDLEIIFFVNKLVYINLLFHLIKYKIYLLLLHMKLLFHFYEIFHI